MVLAPADAPLRVHAQGAAVTFKLKRTPFSKQPLKAGAVVQLGVGMQFVPVPIVGGPTAGKTVLFSVWDTRVQDYEVYIRETERPWKSVSDSRPAYPVVVSWDEATAFCAWLTAHGSSCLELVAVAPHRRRP